MEKVSWSLSCAVGTSLQQGRWGPRCYAQWGIVESSGDCTGTISFTGRHGALHQETWISKFRQRQQKQLQQYCHGRRRHNFTEVLHRRRTSRGQVSMGDPCTACELCPLYLPDCHSLCYRHCLAQSLTIIIKIERSSIEEKSHGRVHCFHRATILTPLFPVPLKSPLYRS